MTSCTAPNMALNCPSQSHQAWHHTASYPALIHTHSLTRTLTYSCHLHTCTLIHSSLATASSPLPAIACLPCSFHLCASHLSGPCSTPLILWPYCLPQGSQLSTAQPLHPMTSGLPSLGLPAVLGTVTPAASPCGPPMSQTSLIPLVLGFPAS